MSIPFSKSRFTALFLALFLLLSLSTPLLGKATALNPNLITNSSAETVDPANAQQAQGWSTGQWGTNTSVFSYSSVAHTGTHGLSISTSSYTNGDAKWYFTPVAITANTAYTFSDFYQSTTATSTVAQFDNGAGTYSYVSLASVPAAATWTQTTTSFTSPATAKNVTIFHLISSVGTLTIDDAVLALTETTPPTPVPTPTDGNLIANNSFETATSANAALPAGWQQGGWGTNTATYSYPTTGAQDGTRSAGVAISAYTSGDAKWYFTPVAVTAGSTYSFSDYYKASVATALVAQFDNGAGTYSYVTLGTAAVSATTWKQFSTTITVPTGMKNLTIFHTLAGVGSLQTDTYSLKPLTAPTVSLSAPTAAAQVSGTVALAANAADQSGAVSVKFMVDGSAFGAAIASAPFQLQWDTTQVGNGPHTITAVATNASTVSTTSSPVQVTVANAVSGNMIPNGSVETVDPANSKLPKGWQHGNWGTNTAAFTYATTGHTGTRSIKAQITKYTNGSAYWYFAGQAVVAGQAYDFTDYYESNISSEIDAVLTMNDGSIQYMYLGDASPSPKSWTKFQKQFSAPAGAVSVAMYHNINAVGFVTTDDFNLVPFTYVGFKRPIVSLTFDDGYLSTYQNGLPLLQKYGLPSTQYIISGYVDTDPSYITTAMLKDYFAKGHEIGSHTVSHPDLTTLTAAKADTELKNSQSTLQAALAASVKAFASPYGAINQAVVTNAKKYYTSYRGVEAGYNAKNNFDAYNILVQNIVDTTTPAEVNAWVQQAIATNTWLVLVYHQVDPSAAAGVYNTFPADLDSELASIKVSGVTVDTVGQALAELVPQL